MIEIRHINSPDDWTTGRELCKLYEGIFPIAPVIHAALAHPGMFHVFAAYENPPVVIGSPTLVGAAILKSPEVVSPIGEDIRPLAWVISDVVVHPSRRKQNIGFQLVRYLEGMVAKNGGRITYLYTETTNEPAIRLYRKAGFERLPDQGDKAVFVKLVRE